MTFQMKSQFRGVIVIEESLKDFARLKNLRIIYKKIDEERKYGFCRAIKLDSNFEECFHYDNEKMIWY